ncbi:MAG: ribosome maturation factor RimM [Actinomycetota bacterium]|nr:ribosome maturation factor RimM [Actinomycetota bacterium]
MKLLEVARIGKAHGLRGEVSVHLISNVLQRVAPGSVLYLENKREMRIKSAKPYKQNYLVLFEGVTSRVSAEELVGEKLFGTPIDDADMMWAHEVIGSYVVDGGGMIGKVVAIESNPASDLLILEDGSIIPLTFVVEQKDQNIHVEIPLGLLERDL